MLRRAAHTLLRSQEKLSTRCQLQLRDCKQMTNFTQQISSRQDIKPQQH